MSEVRFESENIDTIPESDRLISPVSEKPFPLGHSTHSLMSALNPLWRIFLFQLEEAQRRDAPEDLCGVAGR